MAIYIFYLSRANVACSLEAFELVDDSAALDLAPQVLAGHATCTSVEICEAARHVGRLDRETSAATFFDTSTGETSEGDRPAV